MKNDSPEKSKKGYDWFPKLAISSAIDNFKLKTMTTSNSKNMQYAMNCLCAGSAINPFVFLLSPFFIIGKRTQPYNVAHIIWLYDIAIWYGPYWMSHMISLGRLGVWYVVQTTRLYVHIMTNDNIICSYMNE